MIVFYEKYSWFFWLFLLFLPFFLLRTRRALTQLLSKAELHRCWKRCLTLQLSSYSLLLLALLLLVLSIDSRRPASSNQKDLQGEGVNIAFAIDISRSMLAEDAVSSRLQAVVSWLRFFVNSFPQSRYSLTVFKGSAFNILPLSSDLKQLDRLFDYLSPAMLSSTGTALDSGIDLALQSLERLDNPRSVLIVLTDGEGQDTAYQRASRLLRDWYGQFYIIGVGDSEGQKIPVDDDFVRDSSGAVVISKLEASKLRALAFKNGGYYFHLNKKDLMEQMYQMINPLSYADGEPYQGGGVQHYFLLAALFFLLVAWVLRYIPLFPKHNSLRGR